MTIDSTTRMNPGKFFSQCSEMARAMIALNHSLRPTILTASATSPLVQRVQFDPASPLETMLPSIRSFFDTNTVEAYVVAMEMTRTPDDPDAFEDDKEVLMLIMVGKDMPPRQEVYEIERTATGRRAERAITTDLKPTPLFSLFPDTPSPTIH